MWRRTPLTGILRLDFGGVPLTFAGMLDRTAVTEAVALVSALVARPEVAAAWGQESTCAGMTVGGLTWHLVGQPQRVVTLLDASQPEAGEAIPLLEHYARAAWVREDLEGDTNRAIRDSSEEQAAAGHDAAVAALAEAGAQLPSVLAEASPVTFIPWQNWSLATDDFLVTRLMEMVVHSDDLAASVGVDTPEFGESVLDPVLRLLTALALSRHGQDALVRALTRPQRAPATISAF